MISCAKQNFVATMFNMKTSKTAWEVKLGDKINGAEVVVVKHDHEEFRVDIVLSNGLSLREGASQWMVVETRN